MEFAKPLIYDKIVQGLVLLIDQINSPKSVMQFVLQVAQPILGLSALVFARHYLPIPNEEYTVINIALLCAIAGTLTSAAIPATRISALFDRIKLPWVIFVLFWSVLWLISVPPTGSVSDSMIQMAVQAILSSLSYGFGILVGVLLKGISERLKI